MSNEQNDKLMDEFLDECTTEWRCPYCGDPSSEEWPVCCKENHCAETLCAPDGTMIGEDSDVLKECFVDWLLHRGEP